MFDVDSDGRPDIVQVTSSTTALVYFNLGGQFFSTGSPYPIGATGVKGILRTITGRDSTDAPVGSSVPPSVTHLAALQETSGVVTYTKSKTEIDGHGRPTKTIAYAFQTATDADPGNSVTWNAYRLDGTLSDVNVPDPTVDSAATVTYSYTFDSLGRALTMRRPQLAGDTGRTGVNISYDGLTKIVAEEAPSSTAGGSRASTKTTVDADGRLVKIEEGTVAPSSTSPYAAASYVTTAYAYFPDGGVKQIVDPELEVTTMTRDLAGHRTSISRGGQTWRYAYDPNGNLMAETSPCAPSPGCDAAYTTTFTYDTLDRAYLKWIARRELSDADLDLFGASQEATLWDVGANDRGRVSQTVSLTRTGAEVLRSWNVHDAQGQTLLHWQSFNIPGFSQIRSTQYTYLLGGSPDTVSYNDNGNGATATTKSKIGYDARGLPRTLSVSTDSGSSWQGTRDTRNVAGLVTRRRTTFPGSRIRPPIPYVESMWTYDSLGRVVDQKVNTGTTQVARQQLTYSGTDDPKTLITSFETTAKPTQTFGYDFQHQLTSITGNANYFGATYAYNPAGRFQTAEETQVAPLPAGTEVRPRNVNYNYAGPDPEQVTSLTNVSGGATLESYTYDPSGNQLTRAEPGTGLSWTYLYDGENQLRRATKKQGATVVGSEEYWYDGGGARTQLVKRDGAGVKTETIWFLDGTEAHYAANNSVSHVYSNISLGTPVARTDRINDALIKTEYQFHGLAGSTLVAIDKEGTINATFHYAPFGEVIESTGRETATHERRFNDKQQDDLTTLTYYGARYYDKLLMGWTQADPLYLRVPDLGKQSTPRRSNLAVFSLNNPVRYVDPDGRNAASYVPGPAAAYVSEGEMMDRSARARMASEGGYVGNDCAHFSGRCHYLVFGSGGAFSAMGQVPVCGGGRGYCETGDGDGSYGSTPGGSEDIPSTKGIEKRLAFMVGLSIACPMCAGILGVASAGNDGEVALAMVGGGGSSLTGLAAKIARGLGALRGEGSFVVYQLVDEAADPVRYGYSAAYRVETRLIEHSVKPPGPWVGMQIISGPVAKAQAMALETALIADATAVGRTLWNVAPVSIRPPFPIAVPPTIAPTSSMLNTVLYPR